MSQRQPLTKAELKQMILHVMYELQFGSMSNYASGMNSIIPYWINEHYNLKMSVEEKALALETVQDLKDDGYIIKDAVKDDDNFQVLTPAGKEFLHKEQEVTTTLAANAKLSVVMESCVIKLDDVVKNPDLLEACNSSFNSGDYKTAVLNAFRFLEAKVNAAAQLSGKDFGTVLMAKAFSPSIGKLEFGPDATVEEQDGVHNLFNGAIALFGNSESHLSIDYSDKLKAIQIIAFVELLLEILSKTQLIP